MQEYGGVEIHLPSFLNTTLNRGENKYRPWPLYPQERSPVHTEKEARWAPQPVWTFEEDKNLLPLQRNCQ
jgi:hypothetical protein